MTDNDHPPLVLYVETSPTMLAYLEDLARTGTYGNEAAEVAKSLVEEGIRRAIAEGLLKVRL